MTNSKKLMLVFDFIAEYLSEKEEIKEKALIVEMAKSEPNLEPIKKVDESVDHILKVMQKVELNEKMGSTNYDVVSNVSKLIAKEKANARKVAKEHQAEEEKELDKMAERDMGLILSKRGEDMGKALKDVLTDAKTKVYSIDHMNSKID